MPRDSLYDNIVKSDLFALRSTLYKLFTRKESYKGRSFKLIKNLFRKGVFSAVNGLPLSDLIMSY